MKRGYATFENNQVPDQRSEHKFGKAFGTKDKELYNSLIDLILNHKAELRKYPEAMNRTTAGEWGQKRGLRLGPAGEDLNHDGVEDIVLYNKAGNPVIINGYKPVPSDFGARQEYYENNKTKESRIGNSFSDWGKKFYYETQKDPNNPWKQSVRKTNRATILKQEGWRIPTAPKKQLSVYSIFCKLIAPIVRDWEETPPEGADVSLLQAQILGENSGPSNIAIFKRIVSPISIYRSLYMKMILRPYFFELTNAGTIPSDYGVFKQYIKEHGANLYMFFRQFLTDDQTDFKPEYKTTHVIGTQMVKGNCDFNGTDEDDAIVFLMDPKKNLKDEEFKSVLQREDSAAAFLKDLKSSGKPKRDCTIRMNKWKANAAASTKDFFANQIKWLFENDDAFNRYKEIRQNGGNVLIADPEVAREQAEAGNEAPEVDLPQQQANDEDENITVEMTPEDLQAAATGNDAVKRGIARKYGVDLESLNNYIAEMMNTGDGNQ